MASTLTTRITWSDGLVFVSGSNTYRSRYGSSPVPSGVWSLANGTGAGQANSAYENTITILSGATFQLDLRGSNGEVDLGGLQLAFNTVKWVELILTTPPASGISLRLGPQGVANAAQLWFKANDLNQYCEIRDRFVNGDMAVGWQVSGNGRVIAINNPSLVSVSAWLRVIGTR